MMNMKKNIFIAFVFYISSVISASSRDVYQMKVGDFTVIAVQDTPFEMNSGLIVNGKEDVIKNYMPEGKVSSSVNAFIIKTGKQIILIDAGAGNRLITNMKKAAISPKDVDLILLTHGHFDHVEGLIKNDQAVFPKAKLMLSDKEKSTFSDSAIKATPPELNKFLLKANQVLKIYADRMETFNSEKPIVEGVTAVDMYGHTPGHTGYMVESRGQKILVVGDILHITAIQFAHPEYSLLYDKDPAMAANKRQTILSKVAKDKIPIAAVHVPFPGIGYVSTGEEGFVFTFIK